MPTLFNDLGIFVFAISGASAGLRKQADLFGVAVLAIVAACCGGIIHDVLIGVALIREATCTLVHI